LLALRVWSFVLAFKAGRGTRFPALHNRPFFIEVLPCNTG